VSSGSDLTLSWTPTLSEYERALKLWRDAAGQRQRSRNRGATVATAGFVLLVFVLLSGGSNRALAAVAPVVLLVVGLVWRSDLVPVWGLRRTVRRAPALLEPVTVTVGKDGLVSRTGAATQRFGWSSFTAYVEIPDMLLLGLSLDTPAVSGILPRSAASSTSVWDSVTARARRNVPLHPRLAHLEAQQPPRPERGRR
jgi:hypothetical protein